MTAQQTETPTTNQTAPAEMFWILTAQPAQTRAGESALYTFKGTFTPLPGDTRADAFAKIRDYVSGQLTRIGQPSSFSVLFFSLEPNQL